uniref:G_PROTEIN_RECEP_F3_4 domain-containing protein n=1 Tax=Panagrellus redivivus TaxID=6233 RepID=A0A7E4VVT9_PANRE
MASHFAVMRPKWRWHPQSVAACLLLMALLSISTITASASNVSTAITTETFEELLMELESTAHCNRTVRGALVHKLINDSMSQNKFDKMTLFLLTILNTAPYIANVKNNPLHVTVTSQPPIPTPKKPKEAAFALQLVCKDPSKHQYHLHPHDAVWTPIAVYYTPSPDSYMVVRLPPIDLDVCAFSDCLDSKCSWTMHGQTRVWARSCCDDQSKLCRHDWSVLRILFYVLAAFLAIVSFIMIPVVVRERRRQQQESRGWALIELFFVGAALLYLIPLLDYPNADSTCIAAVWMRQIGFTLFYGSIVLKIYRNLQEYRVRKAHHVIVREQDMLKYLLGLMALTIIGLVAWSLGSYKNQNLWSAQWPQCPMEKWSIMWAAYELAFLLYGLRLCYKARSSHWNERNQFTAAVVIEAVVTLTVNVVRYSLRHSGSRDLLMLITAIQIFATISINIFIIIMPKFISVGGESNRRTLTMSGAGNSGRAHPSLAKLRDNLINGTIDFAEVPIIDMNPEDIRAELKRVYTQLRMYKLKNLYQDNPHISKRKGGKKTSDKTTKNRRISIPPTSSSPKIRRVDEEEEKSDLTVESAPHNIYLSTNKIQLESADQSVRV